MSSPADSTGDSPVDSPAGLTPVRGGAADILELLRAWDAADDPAPLTVETSGSTGEPKRVVLSRTAMRASADATHTRLGGPGRWLLILPPTYVAGLQVLFRSVRAGTEPVVGDDLAALGQLGPGRCYVSLVPTQLRRILDDEPAARDLAGFDAVLIGGARMQGGLRAAAAERGIRVVATYGMSETCGGCVYDGRPLDGVRVRVGDDGRVRIGGDVLFSGYREDRDLTDSVLEDGWFVTSDQGRIEPDGRLQVLGRVDDVVVSGGVNVPVSAVGERLSEHADVRAVEVVGVDDAYWGSAVVAVAVTGSGTDELRDWVGAVHPRSWAPQLVVRLPALPMLPTGKVDRLAVRRIAAEARADRDEGTGGR